MRSREIKIFCNFKCYLLFIFSVRSVRYFWSNFIDQSSGWNMKINTSLTFSTKDSQVWQVTLWQDLVAATKNLGIRAKVSEACGTISGFRSRHQRVWSPWIAVYVNKIAKEIQLYNTMKELNRNENRENSIPL